MTRKKREIHYNVRLAIRVADEYRNISRAFSDKQERLTIEEFSKTKPNIGEIVASATNLALAVELYFKSLYMVLDLTVPDTHSHWSLCKNLPNETTKDLYAFYDSRSLPRVGMVGVTRVYIKKDSGGVFDPPNEIKKPPGEDMKSLLIRTSDAFVTWRYFYEHEKTDDWRLFEYEHLRLSLVCEAVRSKVIDVLNSKKIALA